MDAPTVSSRKPSLPPPPPRIDPHLGPTIASTLGCCFLLHVASGFGEVIALIAADLLLVVV